MNGEQQKHHKMRTCADKALDNTHKQKTIDRIVLARLRAPHGVGGRVKIESFVEPPEAIANYDKLRCDQLDSGFVKISELRRYKDARGLLGKILGCETREQADALRDAQLYILQQDLPQLEEDCFYHQSLIGLPVQDEYEKLLGEVASLQNFGAGDLLGIRITDNQKEQNESSSKCHSADKGKGKAKRNRKAENVFIPFSREVVVRVDKNGIVVRGFYAENLAKSLAKNLAEKQPHTALASLARNKKQV